MTATKLESHLTHENEVSRSSHQTNPDHYDLPEFHFSKNRVKYWEKTTKRTIDIIGALTGLLLFGGVFLFIAGCIKLTSRGKVLFIQDRIGRNGRIFHCYKFRTMRYTTADYEDQKSPCSAAAPDIARKGDPRIFPFGNFLRRTNLDELPQLFNILKGDMSLVGPRPYPVEECQYWRSIIPNWSLRYSVRPGLTGWAQVTGYRGGNLDPLHMDYRLKRDFKYIERYKPGLDFQIIWRTIKQMMMRHTNAH